VIVHSNRENSLIIEQGYELARPSLVRATLYLDAGNLLSVDVGGSAVKFLSGQLHV
jgi:predicted PhzF superfamily epimerase YddE/YHI9